MVTAATTSSDAEDDEEDDEGNVAVADSDDDEETSTVFQEVASAVKSVEAELPVKKKIIKKRVTKKTEAEA